MRLNFIKSSEKKEIVSVLKHFYGIDELPYLLIRTGKGKIRGYSGNLSKEEISLLGELVRLETVGAYLINERGEGFRISFDALSNSVLKKQICKNIVEINDEQFNLWIRGYDLEIKFVESFVVLKYKDDFVGIGKSNGKRIINYLPKERILKSDFKGKSCCL